MTEFINWLSGELNNINYEMAEAIGLTLIDPEQFIGIFVRFCLNLAVVSIIARYFYYPRSKRRDYMFVFIIMSMSIFMLVSFMGGDSLRTGAALGLFALFGIIRYRTEAIPIREMTYLFMLIALSVINALARAEYHPKADYWDGFGIVTILFVNLVFLGMAWIFESSKLVSTSCSRYIRYDNVSLIAPDKREELKADLEKRTGLKIDRIEVGLIDFMKDGCLIRIFYNNEADRGNSIEEMVKIPRM